MCDPNNFTCPHRSFVTSGLPTKNPPQKWVAKPTPKFTTQVGNLLVLRTLSNPAYTAKISKFKGDAAFQTSDLRQVQTAWAYKLEFMHVHADQIVSHVNDYLLPATSPLPRPFCVGARMGANSGSH